MFDKNQFLKVLVESKKKEVLTALATELSEKDSLEYLEIVKKLEENPESALELVEIKNKDINYLMTSVLQYEKCEPRNVELPFTIKMKLEKETLPNDYDNKHLLASLLYLVNTDNKYRNLATDVLCGYSSYKNHRLLTFLENKNKLLEELNKVETIISDKDYKGIDSFYGWKEILDGTIEDSIFDEISLYGKDEVDYSLLAKLLKLNEDDYKNKNNYFNFKRMKEDLKGNNNYSFEEAKMAILLAESMNISMSYEQYELTLNRTNPKLYEDIKFSDIINFINFYDSATLSDKPFDFDKLSHFISRYNGSTYSTYYDESQLFRNLYNEYRKANFSFKMDDFCNYINSIKKEKNLEDKIADSKLDKSNTDFDLSSFMYFIGSLSKNIELHTLAPYIPSLLKTESGKKYFGPMIKEELETIKEIENLYSNDDFDELVQHAYKLASLSNYRIESYARKFIQPENSAKFKAVCDWLKTKDKDIFKNSIDAKYNKKKDRERAVEETRNYFLSLPFGELKALDINEYYETLKLPIKIGYIDHELGLSTITELQREICSTKLDAVCLEETKELLKLFKEGKSLSEYVDASEYDYEEIYYIINKAGLKLESDTSALVSKIKEEQDLEKQAKTKETVKNLVNLFAKSSFDNMTSFYEYVSKEYGLNENEQKKLFDLATKDEELNKIVVEKRTDIREKQIQRNNEQATLRAKARLANVVNNYGKEAVKAMHSFIEVDDCTIKKFCKIADISEKDFRFYRKLCAEVDESLSEEVDNKCKVTRQKFIRFIISSARETALEMKRCHKEKVPYDLYSHYEKYGISPYKIADIASNFDRINESKLISQYMNIHRSIFSPIGSATIESMKRRTAIYTGNLFLENDIVSYRKKDLEQAINDLNDKGIPIYVGTLYQSLTKLKESSKNNNKTYTKATPTKK